MLLRTCTRLPRRCSARDVSTATTASRTRGRLALGGAAAVAAAGIGAYALDYVGRTRKVDEVFAFDRDLKTVVATAERATRVGFEARVGHELQALREWHAARGYLGGIVLRSLDEGVYSNAPVAAAAAPNGPPVLHAERECYYLYYEVLPNGQRVQQLFVRGTANLADVKTDLKTTLVYDEELGCNVHEGFRAKAEGLLDDVAPLLVRDARSTVELAGHSLGGAVALLCAMKLAKRGHTVRAVTTLGAPKVTDAEGAAVLAAVPVERVLRIEHEHDPVPHLPVLGEYTPCGDKLLLLGEPFGDRAVYVPEPASRLWFVNWAPIHLKLRNATEWNTCHRAPTYRDRLWALRDGASRFVGWDERHDPVLARDVSAQEDAELEVAAAEVRGAAGAGG